jgi:lysophospholipase L1-like esterase
MKIRGVLTILFFVAISNITSAQTNLDFEQGLKGWHITGKAIIDQTDPHKNKACARIESGSIFTRVPVSQLTVVQFGGYVRSGEKSIKALPFLRFYNSAHRLLLEYKSKVIDTTIYQQTGNYTESPAGTAYMEIGVEKLPGNGYIYTDDFSIEINVGEPKIRHQSQVNLNQYMRPFWNSDTIYNETVLLYSVNGKPADGKLLYTPDHILSIKSFDLKNTYAEGRDYAINGNMITRSSNSIMPFRADTSFDTKKDLAWFNTQSQWVVVTYTHHDKWNGLVPVYKGSQLPNTIAKLKAKKPVKIVAFGMSITRGLNISSYDGVAPYMPTYVDLFARQLRKAYHNPAVKLYNAGLPGSLVDWGALYADQYISALKPDLVILDFGMNDFWRYTPEQFKGYIETIMRKVRATNPKVEFLLLSNMKFDPDYVLDSDQNKAFYTGNLEGYSKVLKQMEAKGVINLDMYAISDAIYRLKKAKDCISNPLHPNDYLARWYAQGLSALLIKNK